MKKFKWKILGLSLILSMLFSLTVFASPRNSDIHTPSKKSELLSIDRTYSVDTCLVLTRGSIISSCIAKISNVGGGEIGIFAQTLPHVSVDWGYITIYLDRWSDEQEDWINCKKYEYEFLPENEPDGVLDMMAVDFHETSQPSGYYYRVWAYHEVEKNGMWQAKKTTTDGVFITSTP